MPAADDILAHPAARRLSLAHDAAASLAALGWRTARSAVHSGGTADVAADRSWSRGALAARVRLIVHCDARPERLLLSSLEASSHDRLPSYSFGDDDPAQRRALAEIILPADLARLHRTAYPHEAAATEPARVDALPARARAAAARDEVLDEAFASVDAVRRDLLQYDLDVVRDDMDIDRDVAVETALHAAQRCELLQPIIVTDAELWSLPDRRRHDWIRIERSSLVGHERRWIDVVRGDAFASYADALTRHLAAIYRKRRFAAQ